MIKNTNTKTAIKAFQSSRAQNNRTMVVIPCYNEAERLNQSEFLSFLSNNPTTDFIFVNDGSKDETLDVLCSMQNKAPTRIYVLNLSQNAGKAEAVRQGLIAAIQMNAEFVGYWDADLATPLDAICDFTRILSRFPETQVVFGARRAMLGHRVERTMGRRIVSRICATLARQAVRLPIGDTQCGAKLMRNTPLLRKAISTMFTAGWLFDVELFTRLSAQMRDKTNTFYEQPLAEWTEVPGSKVSSSAIMKSGIRMLQLIAKSRFGLTFASVAKSTSQPSASVHAALMTDEISASAA